MFGQEGFPGAEFDPLFVQKIEYLANKHTAGEIAANHNEAGVIHPRRGIFDTNAIVYLLKRFNIPSLKQRLRDAGYTYHRWLRSPRAGRSGTLPEKFTTQINP
jgi:hypothetical protein